MSEETAVSTQNVAGEVKKRERTGRRRFAEFVAWLVPSFLKRAFWALDRRCGGDLSFFFRHYGKTKFMVAYSKKIQYLGIERVYNMDRWAFARFFTYYLVRDLLLYIALPIYIARALFS